MTANTDSCTAGARRSSDEGGSPRASDTFIGEVVKLDRKFPMVQLEDGRRLRCEHSASLKKGGDMRAAIGDVVEVALPDGHDQGVIEAIRPRRTAFVRKDPVDRVLSQTLAANFDRVVIVHPVDRLNLKRMERELVLAHETGADVLVALSKSDLLAPEELAQRIDQVQALAGAVVQVCAISSEDSSSLEALRDLLGEGSTSILIGSSGAGKSTLVNRLLGDEVRAVSDVRASDGKGRHKTVSREILALPIRAGSKEALERPAGMAAEAIADTACETMSMPARIVDMPGVRGLGLWEAQEGIETAFPDIEDLALQCRFRDCKHGSEPGCAVRAAVEAGSLDEARVQSYRSLRDELAQTEKRRERASWKNK